MVDAAVVCCVATGVGVVEFSEAERDVLAFVADICEAEHDVRAFVPDTELV